MSSAASPDCDPVDAPSWVTVLVSPKQVWYVEMSLGV